MEEKKNDRQESSPENPVCPWPLEYMKYETFKKGQVLFKKGDKADKMFYISRGSLKLTEIDKVIGEGQIIGEMGVFSPFNQRTASAVCEEDMETYTMGKDEVLEMFTGAPFLAISLIQLSVKRFIENLKAETAARERIESELRIAAEIQMSMLPQKFPPFPERNEFDIFAVMDPAKEVGGDFYDFFFVDKNKLCFVIGDVSGKGVPAALFMAICKTVLKTEAMRGLSPKDIIYQVNNALCPDNQLCMFVTIFCVILDVETGEIEFTNGGHNPPLLCSGNVCYEFLDVPKGFVIGAMENVKCENRKIQLKPGDVIFMYTDGVTEAMNPRKKLFSETRLKECVTRFKDKDIKDLIHSMREEIGIFAQGEPQSDDITMMALKYKGAGFNPG
ncbi:MAG: SpoIIE family protein phosphatase [Candidatus Omnitrophota bacterium]|jgi:sigma-B regulation protein RsbU (phosphoserine phosphatase)